MRVYSIFDDFTDEASEIVRNAGAALTVHPLGVPRPDHDRMKDILRAYDCVIIGTTQKITPDQFEGIDSPRIIATASVGLDHIQIPEEKKALVTVIHTPKANAQAVAEYTMGCALSCVKRLAEGNRLYREGKNNKALSRKPAELAGKTLGVVGAGNISQRIMDFGGFFGMEVLCWTHNPDRHAALTEKGVRFCTLEELAEKADVLSVNLPNNDGTKGIISESLVGRMKTEAVFISVSRLPTVDARALIERSRAYPNFYTCLDVDLDEDLIRQAGSLENVMITPHIAGGTVETRKRMFRELADSIAHLIRGEFADEKISDPGRL